MSLIPSESGGEGTDSIFGNDSDDVLFGDSGSNIIFGGPFFYQKLTSSTNIVTHPSRPYRKQYESISRKVKILKSQNTSSSTLGKNISSYDYNLAVFKYSSCKVLSFSR